MHSILGHSKENRHRDLPLIELDENDNNKNTEMVLKGIKKVFTAMGLPLLEETAENSEYRSVYTQNEDDFVVNVHATYFSNISCIRISAYYGIAPKSKRKKIGELINRMNIGFPLTRLMMIPDGGDILIDVGMPLSKWFNTQELFWNLKTILYNGACYLIALRVLLSSDKTPVSIMDLFYKVFQKHQTEAEEIDLVKK